MSNVGKISTTTASTVNCTDNFVLLIVLCLTFEIAVCPISKTLLNLILDTSQFHCELLCIL